MTLPSTDIISVVAREIVRSHAQDIEFMSVGEMMSGDPRFDEVTEEEFDGLQEAIHDQARAYADTLVWPDERDDSFATVAAELVSTKEALNALLTQRDDDLCVLAAFLLPNRRPIEHWLAILANHFGGRAQGLMQDADRFAAARFRVGSVPPELVEKYNAELDGEATS